MKHAANRRAASRQRWAAPIWDYSGEIKPLNPDTYRPRDRYGTRDAANPPDRDHDEELAARDEWEEQR